MKKNIINILLLLFDSKLFRYNIKLNINATIEFNTMHEIINFFQQNKNKITIDNANSSATCYAVTELIRKTNKTVLLVTQNSDQAYQIKDGINFFLDETEKEYYVHFPDWEILPYDHFSPHQDIISQRLKTLYYLSNHYYKCIIVSIPTLMHYLCPKTYLQANVFILKTNECFNLDERKAQLEQAGYQRVNNVYEHGEFSIRGSIIDLFPMGASLPFRIDLFDNNIDTIRTFDPDTQKSIKNVESIKILPAHEFPIHLQAKKLFMQKFKDRFDVDYKNCPIYQDVKKGIASVGIEYYIPLFFDHNSTLFDYLPTDSILINYQHNLQTADFFWNEVSERYNNRKDDSQRPILSPNEIILKPDLLWHRTKSYRRIDLQSISKEKTDTKKQNFHFNHPTLPKVEFSTKKNNPFKTFQEFLNSNIRVLLIVETLGRQEILIDLLNNTKINPTKYNSFESFLNSNNALGITLGNLEESLIIANLNIALIPESLLLGQKVIQKRRSSKQGDFDQSQVFKNFLELNHGIPVVHIEHGIGRYQGLKVFEIENKKNEFLTILYADEAKLYVPITSLHLIARYTGASPESAPLHRLGSDQWKKARKKAAEKVQDTATELLEIYAKRKIRQGFSFPIHDIEYQKFCNEFPFEETIDQQNAIEATVKDMNAHTPMDRLICGDVGFGKTEVAMRAAFIASQSSKQVAILVPTTLLAQQHYESFRDRFADWPINIGIMSRFQTTKNSTETKKKLKDGLLDIVIGTHKIIQKKIVFKDLGLIIIDEEHRFGVRHKETLKNLRAEVDVLALTATPIPRTLNMAMSGIRDLSIIATPPARRLSIKTFVRDFNKSLIQESIVRELMRGGQVYYLHNEVATIEAIADDLKLWIPEARIAIAHGQMREKDLEQIMANFYHKRFNVLICTTIIETGIDIPNANTIIINRADKFGLAQLHQLRGRVGRSHHQAYAYLLTTKSKKLTSNASKRLQAIEESQDLGAGFMLASNDLEIRGAGELLGDDQSGQIQHIGFTLYSEMLEKAVNDLQTGKIPSINDPCIQNTDINLRISALLPEDYISEVNTRLIIYKRLSSMTNTEEIKQLQIELIDRFGILPMPAQNLINQTKLKIQSQLLGINKIQFYNNEISFEFDKNTKVESQLIINLIQSQPNKYKITGSHTLKCAANVETSEQKFNFIQNMFSLFTKKN